MAPVEAPKAKKTSAYFSFCKQHREQTKARLRESGKSVSAPALIKALSELWRSLSDEEKQKYKEAPGSLDHAAACVSPRVQETDDFADAEDEKECEADATVCADREGVQENAKDQGNLEDNGELVLPLARVKRIIKMDRDIRVVAADASILIGHAAQLFLEHLAMGALAAAVNKKHKTIRIEDVMNSVKCEPRIDEFLAEALDDMLRNGKADNSYSGEGVDDAPENVNAKAHPNKKTKPVKKSLSEPVAGTKKIAEFFVASNRRNVSNVNAE